MISQGILAQKYVLMNLTRVHSTAYHKWTKSSIPKYTYFSDIVEGDIQVFCLRCLGMKLDPVDTHMVGVGVVDSYDYK